MIVRSLGRCYTAGLRARFAAKPFEELLNEMSSPKVILMVAIRISVLFSLVYPSQPLVWTEDQTSDLVWTEDQVSFHLVLMGACLGHSPR
jgi:hypothetical protein